MSKQKPTMEDMLWRFPHVVKQSLKKLSNKNLAKCKKIARTWEHFIINEKFYNQRVKYKTTLFKNSKISWFNSERVTVVSLGLQAHGQMYTNLFLKFGRRMFKKIKFFHVFGKKTLYFCYFWPTSGTVRHLSFKWKL